MNAILEMGGPEPWRHQKGTGSVQAVSFQGLLTRVESGKAFMLSAARADNIAEKNNRAVSEQIFFIIIEYGHL